jgi:hypothetical protein
VRLPSPAESLELQPARRLPTTSSFLGVPYPSRSQPAESTFSRHSRDALRGSRVPLSSVLGVSHALDGFLLRLPCGFVSPHNRDRACFPSGVFPLARSPDSSSVVALLPLRASPCFLQLPAPRDRLQGFAPCEDSLRQRKGLACATVRSPPGFPAPSGSASPAVGSPSCSLRPRPWSALRQALPSTYHRPATRPTLASPSPRPSFLACLAATLASDSG